MTIDKKAGRGPVITDSNVRPLARRDIDIGIRESSGAIEAKFSTTETKPERVRKVGGKDRLTARRILTFHPRLQSHGSILLPAREALIGKVAIGRAVVVVAAEWGWTNGFENDVKFARRDIARLVGRRAGDRGIAKGEEASARGRT